MIKYILVFVSLFISLFVVSQDVVSTQGDSYSNANASIDFTIGEVVISTGSDGTNDITQGFHQTKWSYVGLENHSPKYDVTIFPNPTEDVLNVQTLQFDNVTYMIFDVNGKLILHDKLSEEITAIEVGQLAPGSYSLILKDNQQKLKTFKLIKSQ